MTESETPKKPRGRPPKTDPAERTVPATFRLSLKLKAETERLALELARRDGKEVGNVTAYLHEALRRENARVQKLLQRQGAASA